MSEEILVNVTPQETRVAVMHLGAVQELHIERAQCRGLVSNIYMGRVVRVLPGVMGIEAFAEAATVLLPGWVPVAAEDVAFLAPFKFYRDEPRELDIRVALRDGGDGTVVARCRLLGRRRGRAQPGDIGLRRRRRSRRPCARPLLRGQRRDDRLV